MKKNRRDGVRQQLTELLDLPLLPTLSSFSFQARSRRAPPGQEPGVLVEPPDAHASSIELHVWDEEHHEEQSDASLDDVRAALAGERRVWVNLVGLGDAGLLRELGGLFGAHPLALEDMLNVHQRAKAEIWEEGIFLVLRMTSADMTKAMEQVSFMLGANAVWTVQERPGDSFDLVRERLRRGGTKLRGSGADYLFHALVDALVDGYYGPLETMGEELDRLEAQALDDPTSKMLVEIRALKRLLLHYRRALWPMRDVLSMLHREESVFITGDTRLYLRDCYDHSLQLLELLETFREVASGLMDVYLSSVSNRMNEVMKVLTIIATIFIPLTFIAGVYGMNFDPEVSPWNMPELGWAFGYPLVMGFMLTISLGLLYYFKRRGWMG